MKENKSSVEERLDKIEFGIRVLQDGLRHVEGETGRFVRRTDRLVDIAISVIRSWEGCLDDNNGMSYSMAALYEAVGGVGGENARQWAEGVVVKRKIAAEAMKAIKEKT